LFVREGAIIPIGKEKTTVTALSGPARTHTDGIDVVIESDGGLVSLDDWRGVLLFPGREGNTYAGEWIEDDGISAEPVVYTVNLSYRGTDDAVEVNVSKEENGFQPLWEGKLHVILPVGDSRKVPQAEQTTWKGRDAWVLEL
jgi:hypothetical protein